VTPAGPELAAGALALLALGGALGFAAGRRAARPRAPDRDSAYVRLLEYAAVAANEATTLDEAMDEGARRICGAMGWPVGRVHTVEREGTLQETRFLLRGGEPDTSPAQGRILDIPTPTGESLAERALASGRPECLPDLAPRPASPGSDLARRLSLRTAVAIPVLTHGHVAAVLEFAMRERMQPDPRTLEVLALVGVQIGRVAERATVQQRFRQAQKLEAIGRLSAGVAHEINNPMAYVRSNLNQLAAEWKRLRDALEHGDGPPPLAASFAACDELLEETIEGVERTVSIVKDMKEFSHVGGDARVAANLDEIVDTALRMASSHAPSTVSVERRSDPDLPRVPCCPNQLVQVLVNLVVNAVEAASPAGRVEVVTCLEDDWAVVQVEDTGPGMGAETRERLFDPFFTTKAAGEGTGLGLTISHEIVRNHGGEIRVISAQGAGTVMEVRLPLEGAPRGPAA